MPRYPWERFWCRTDDFCRTDRHGYLLDPAAFPYEDYARRVSPLSNRDGLKFVALLGDPGMGKSTELLIEFARAQSSRSGTDQATLFRNLNLIDTSLSFAEKVFKEGIRKNLDEGKNDILVFLDDFDECRQNIPILANLLRAELDELGQELSKISFRIACRSTEWPRTLGEWAEGVWGGAQVETLELCRLRRMDVELAAKAEGVSAGQFLSEIESTEAEALAMQPFSLKLLLRHFKTTQSIPASRVQLFRMGVEWAVEEQNVSRIESKRTGEVSPARRLALGRRIAALMVFGGKQTIDLDNSFGARSDSLLVQAFEGVDPQQSVSGSRFSEGEIREVAGTALFSSRGFMLVGFAHRSFGEYLAASYLSELQVGTAQARALFFSPELPSGPIPEHLAETAAWFAAMSPSFRYVLLKDDPGVLVSSDNVFLSGSEKLGILSRYLEVLASGQDIDKFELRDRYKGLACTGMEEVLSTWISNKEASRVVRRAAIEIAEICQLRGLVPVLSAVAFDPCDDLHCREYATASIAKLGEVEDKLRLKEFLRPDVFGDPNDQLRGYALRALWPEHITGQELLCSLGFRHNPSFFGAYLGFISGPFLRHLQASELPIAIEWVSRLGGDHAIEFGLEDAVVEVHRLGWDAIAIPEVLEAMTCLAEARFRGQQSLYLSIRRASSGDMHVEVPICTEARRRLLEKLLPRIGAVIGAAQRLVWTSKPWVNVEDSEWLIELSLGTTNDAFARFIGEILWNLLQSSGTGVQYVSMLELCVGATKRSIGLKDALGPWLEAIPIDSDFANESRRQADYRRETERKIEQFQREQEERRRAATPVGTPSSHIEGFLCEIEAGEMQGWINLNRVLPCDDSWIDKHDWLSINYREFPGWKAADRSTRDRVVSAAARYLLEGRSESETWFLKKGGNLADSFAVRAFLILHFERPDYLQGIGHDVWTRWLVALLASPLRLSNEQDEAAIQSLLLQAYLAEPIPFLETVSRVVRGAADASIVRETTRRLNSCWDERLLREVLVLLKQGGLSREVDFHLMDKLLESDCGPARTLALGRLSSSGDNEEAKNRRVDSALLLITRCPHLLWESVWEVVNADQEFAACVLETLLQHWATGLGNGLNGLADSIGERAVGELHVLLARKYPRGDDEEIQGFHMIGPKETGQRTRDDSLNWLVKRGTPEALRAIQSAHGQLIGDGTLDWRLVEARRQVALRTWVPLTSEDLLSVVSDPRTRLLRSESDLAALAVETLLDIQKDLHGESLRVRFLWIPSGGSLQKPRDESALSDWITSELVTRIRGRGFILGLREVQTRPATPATANSEAVPGEIVDILLSARSEIAGAVQEFRVIIECKGCWNPGRDYALELQLGDRYLRHGRTQTGIYLVGVFDSPQWDPKDHRHKKRFRGSPEILEKKLAQQASLLRGVAVIPFVLDVRLSR